MKKIIFSLCALVLLPQFAFAGPIVRGGETISVDAAQTLEGDFYGLASTVSISGAANEDVYVAGGQVTVNGAVAKDLTILGGTVQIHGAVADDLRIIAGDVVLASSVAGDVVVVGGSLTILSTATVGGDVLFWGGDLVIEGGVAGVIHGISESIRINGTVAGVEYTASRSFVLGDKANIAGDITYTGYSDIVRSQGAVVEGKVNHQKRAAASTQDFLESYALMIATLLFSVLTAYFFMRRVTERLVQKSVVAFGLHGLIGIATFILMPITAIVLMVSMIGGVVGGILLAGYFILLLSSVVFGIIMLGFMVQRLILKKDAVTLYTAVIGVFALSALLFVPVLGGFGVFAIVMVSLGVITKALYESVRG